MSQYFTRNLVVGMSLTVLSAWSAWNTWSLVQQRRETEDWVNRWGARLRNLESSVYCQSVPSPVPDAEDASDNDN